MIICLNLLFIKYICNALFFNSPYMPTDSFTTSWKTQRLNNYLWTICIPIEKPLWRQHCLCSWKDAHQSSLLPIWYLQENQLLIRLHTAVHVQSRVHSTTLQPFEVFDLGICLSSLRSKLLQETASVTIQRETLFPLVSRRFWELERSCCYTARPLCCNPVGGFCEY